MLKTWVSSRMIHFSRQYFTNEVRNETEKLDSFLELQKNYSERTNIYYTASIMYYPLESVPKLITSKGSTSN